MSSQQTATKPGERELASKIKTTSFLDVACQVYWTKGFAFPGSGTAS